VFTMLKKNTKYIPSRIPEKNSNNINDDNNDNNNNDSDSNDANIYKIIENKLGKFAKGNVGPKSDYYNDTYRVEELNCSSYRKTFIVKYIFTYEEDVEVDDISRGYRTIHDTAIEEDTWSADSVEQAILYTYNRFGKTYPFRKKYGDKKNLKFLGIYDVYVKLHYSYIPDCYSNRNSTWNIEFREEYNSENNSKDKE
jgi:hypothetical protein